MKQSNTGHGGPRRLGPIARLVLIGLGAGLSSSSDVVEAQSSRIACTESALVAAISQANVNGSGTITFNCRATTIPMTGGLGTIQNNVVVDGEDRNIILEYTTNFTGCAAGDNGIGGPAIAHLRGRNSVIRNLTFQVLPGVDPVHRPGQSRRRKHFPGTSVFG